MRSWNNLEKRRETSADAMSNRYDGDFAIAFAKEQPWIVAAAGRACASKLFIKQHIHISDSLKSFHTLVYWYLMLDCSR